ncbi:Scr1 family TA system antitoxin-like transcriptional regulator [Amycolatopsis jejuensis]|uniref:Scr1 family TA system antitoxin-like transcriptional regulator n=1 Tax=Amycolatopsis jejuensis TaxID=330084 RepID=UPI000A06F45D|nr:Scr1 family TA system antitoxin-like transcriptional regulator [Amycolatopsis jejuensis]
MPPTPRTRILGASLRNARVEANFGLRELARRIGVTPAMLSNWEQARRSPGVADVAGILGAIGTTGETKRDILHLARGTAEESWVVHGAPSSPGRVIALNAHKRAARSVVTWDPIAIPELLQIVDQQPEPHATPVEAFLSDRAIRAAEAQADSLGYQLMPLLQVHTTSRSLRIRIVHAGLAWHYGLLAGFDLYSMPDGRAVVYCGQPSFGIFTVERHCTVSPYVADVEQLRHIADETGPPADEFRL